MLDKKSKLTEKFYITGEIDKVSSVNIDLIKNHILSNFSMRNRYKDDQYSRFDRFGTNSSS